MCNDVKSFVKRGFWAVHHKVTDQVQMAEQEIIHRNFLRFGPTFTAELYLSNTTTSDSYYENEPLTISCHSTDIPALGPYVMWMWISSDVHQGVLCTRDKGEWLANDVDFVDGKPVYKKKEKNEECNLQKHHNTLTVRVNISMTFARSDIHCHQNTGSTRLWINTVKGMIY